MLGQDTCRACGSSNTYMFLSMGSHPPANQLLRQSQLGGPEPSFPLDAHVCLDCALIQVPNNVPPEFFRHYVYVPSAATTMHVHFAALAEDIKARFAPGAGDLVVDIGSNDGLFLSFCNRIGFRTLGIEPAVNLTEVARKKGIETLNEYFQPETASIAAARYGRAKVIVTTNTFNHIDDLRLFMTGVDTLLASDGVFIVEVPQATTLIENNAFDTIYHEHVSEFSVRSLCELMRPFGIRIFDIRQIPVHGGSMRVYGQRTGTGRPLNPVVDEWLERERQAGLFSRETYDAFRARVETVGGRLLRMLDELKAAGKRIAGYGCPAKGSTLLNFYRIGTDRLEFLADKNELKQGLFSPGMHIPVVAPEQILQHPPDYLLVLAWNFADEIMQEQAEFRRRGGRFIIPIPEPRIE